MPVKSGDTVAIDYTVTTAAGQVVGGTEGHGPQVIEIGGSQIFPQIEQALTGMEVGGKEQVTIAAENAFGERREDMVMDIPRANLPADAQPQPGQVLTAQQENGQQIQLTITEVKDDAVTADANHPLAGEALTFDLTLVEIKQAA
jgi:FKBP-type peptidyl-prolyl cis-trans isomerase SlyD